MNNNYKRILILLISGLAIFFIGKYAIQSPAPDDSANDVPEIQEKVNINNFESVWMSDDGKNVYHLTQIEENSIELKDAVRRNVTILTKSGEQFADSTYTLTLNDFDIDIQFEDVSSKVYKCNTYTGLFTLNENGNTFELCDGSGKFEVAQTGTYDYLIRRYEVLSNNAKTMYTELKGRKIDNTTFYAAYIQRMLPKPSCE